MITLTLTSNLKTSNLKTSTQLLRNQNFKGFMHRARTITIEEPSRQLWLAPSKPTSGSNRRVWENPAKSHFSITRASSDQRPRNAAATNSRRSQSLSCNERKPFISTIEDSSDQRPPDDAEYTSSRHGNRLPRPSSENTATQTSFFRGRDSTPWSR